MDQRQEITVVDIKMPFGSMVVFMVKWAIASIPAFLILLMLFSAVMMFFGIVGGMRPGIHW